MLALRARSSDLKTVLDLERSGNRFTVTVESTKTSSRSQLRLPITLVGPVSLTTGHDWLSVFLKKREELGIPFPGTPFFPMKEGD
eukprot:3429814-Karenia_brevis.AAC.1